jgi:hypothetical protein
LERKPRSNLMHPFLALHEAIPNPKLSTIEYVKNRSHREQRARGGARARRAG